MKEVGVGLDPGLRIGLETGANSPRTGRLAERQAFASSSGASSTSTPSATAGLSRPRGPLCDRLDDILGDPEIAIGVESVGGVVVAREIIEKLIDSGRSVVTANKALLAEAGPALFRRAREKGVSVGFEASVCGGVPIILAIRDGLVANRLESIVGIVNGTANFILTSMKKQGMSYASALAEAQKLGYAEADPTLDVEGGDWRMICASSRPSVWAPTSTSATSAPRASRASSWATSSTPPSWATR